MLLIGEGNIREKFPRRLNSATDSFSIVSSLFVIISPLTLANCYRLEVSLKTFYRRLFFYDVFKRWPKGLSWFIWYGWVEVGLRDALLVEVPSLPYYQYSMLIKPARLRTSETKLALILWSRVESTWSEGDKFTSSSHGFSWLSIMTSNPKSWKQLLRNGTCI